MRTNLISKLLVVLAFCLTAPQFARSQNFDHRHQAFTDILQRHVFWNAAGTASEVDYAALKANPAPLNAYAQSLSQITQAQYNAMSKLEKRAVLINAYNAYTLQLILTKYPNLRSIKELGSLLKSPWKQAFIQFLEKKRSLDDIEHGLLRGASDYDDPRIHFAVNCASIGCPALRPEAFVAAKLDAQLLDQTQRFLRDRSRNRFDQKSQTLFLSTIFKWYGEDFERGFLGASSVSQFVANYGGSLGLRNVDVAALKRDELDVEYTDYDWALNHRVTATKQSQRAAVQAQVAKLYSDIEAKVQDVPVRTASELLRNPSASILLDVRPAAERAVSTIPGAVSETDFVALPAKAKREVVVYCTIGYRSGIAARKLREQGLMAYNLKGGILAWIAEGGALRDASGKATQRVHVYGKQWAAVPKDFVAVF